MPPEPLRRIDWLAVAPWLVILRAPRATVGWPWLIAVLGTIALGPSAIRVANGLHAEGLRLSPASVRMSELGVVAFPPGVDRLGRAAGAPGFGGGGGYGEGGVGPAPTPEPAANWWPWLAFVGWLAVACPIAATAMGPISATPQRSLGAALRATPGAIARLGGAVLLLLVLAGALAGGAWAIGAASATPVLQWGAAPLAGVAWLLCVGLRVAAIVSISLSPLLVAAVMVDRADPFDAVSRLFAYTLQRPLTLLGCYSVAAVAGWLCATLLEVALAGGEAWFGTIVGASPDGAVGEAFDVSVYAARTVARSFYHAYPFVAGVAIYLVMRQAIDGQPFDEIASSQGEGSHDQSARSEA